jgi:hypothetical protein
MRTRLLAWSSVAAAVAVLGIYPVMTDRDSFPLSTYPMFSYPRTTTESVDTAVARDAAGRVVRLSPQLIADDNEVILAGATVSTAIATGHAATLCDEIATRVSGHVSGAVAVDVVTERYDAIRWFAGDRTPIERAVQATCAVRGS